MARRRGRRKSTGLARRSSTTVVYGGASAAGRAAANAAREEKHTIAAVVAAGVLGYAQRENMLDTVPHIEAIGVEGTLGVVAWVAGRYMKSKVAAHVATGLLSVAAWKLANGTTGT